MSDTILIFGGTTEGRMAIEVCEEAGKPFFYSTKGCLQKVDMHNGIGITGAMNGNEIRNFCHANGISCIVDAAHPFADNLHNEIATTGIPVIRLQRQLGKSIPQVEYCSGYDDAIEGMEKAGVQKLLALSGANTIGKLKSYWMRHETVFRILNRDESREIALRNGLPAENVFYYNDGLTLPSLEEEMEMMKGSGCDAMITKESGSAGGYETKVRAALMVRMKVFVIKAPQLKYDWTFVTGKYGLRRAIEQILPTFFPLRTGLTTGACATAAAKAALISLLSDDWPEEVQFALPDGEVLSIPVECSGKGMAMVVKPDNDDPDVTKGCRITAVVKPATSENKVNFLQGSGVGMVTLPGLGIPVGDPAVNPTPRRMIEEEFSTLSDKSYDITISVKDGEELAKKTFNHKVGVVGGISIIGTSGIVKPLSNEAFVESIRRELQVAQAVGCKQIGLVSGMKSERFLLRILKDEAEQKKVELPAIRCIHYGNFVGEALKICNELSIEKVIIAIMIGKAVKLAEGHLDTHSHKVLMNKDFLASIMPEYSEKVYSVSMGRELWQCMPEMFFEKLRQLCYRHCRTVFPNGELQIMIIKEPVS